ncbi:MAG TPA: condensation domain-containing protein, partial [Ferruginibacter sp.]|nr:condensation domain-containing protein [Ferruginibacter sp.]
MQTLLKKLNKFNVKIDLVDKKIVIQAPKGIMTEDLLNEIKLHKNDLIEFITLYKAKENEYTFIPVVPEQTSYTLSSSQRRLWLLSLFEEGNIAYNTPSVFELKGDVKIFSLQSAFQSLIERHESLRTVFKEDETGEVKQVILNHEEIKFQLQYEDVSDEENWLKKTRLIIQNEASYKFDLSVDYLLRAKLVKTSKETYIFICVMHHIISDGWSAEVMTNELFTLYEAYAKGNVNPLPALQLQYKDYAAWQQDQLKNNSIEDHKSYWLQQFEGELPILDLPTHQPRPAIKTYIGKSVNKFYDKSLFEDFNDLCQSQASTLFMGLLATVKVLLYKYTNQKDIIIGSPIAGRQHSDLQNQIGFYVNTLALRTQFDGKDNFKQLLLNVKEVTLGGHEHQVYPFDELVEQLPLKRDMSRNPLFDTIITLQNSDEFKKNKPKIESLEISEFEFKEDITSRFDLEFGFIEFEKGLSLIITYNKDIYDQNFIEGMLRHFSRLLEQIIINPSLSISQL